MKSYNLQFYVEKLKRGEYFSLARYGDGELYCLWGRTGENSNGCRYSPELRQALQDSLQIKSPTFYFGLQRVLLKDRERIENEFPGIDWYDTEIFSEAVANGQLYPLVEQLQKMNVVLICNEEVAPISLLLQAKEVIKVPEKNAYDVRQEVIQKILFRNKVNLPVVYLFSAGMASNALIAELHGKVNGWLIDVGHIWDPFTGNLSRCDLEGKTAEDIQKNWRPYEE